VGDRADHGAEGEKMRAHIDLFSGIGGFSLAAHWAGFTTEVFCERDEFCQKVLNKHWPAVPIVSDIHEFDGTRYHGAELLTASPPCQPYSCIGQQLGSSDDRALWPQVMRIIRECQPDWIVIENVVGFIGMALDDVSADLETENYESGALVLPACSVGANHLRERLWIVAHAQGQPVRLSRQSRPYPHPWDRESSVSRVENGVSNGLDRNRALGNAIVPQVAYQILRHLGSAP
jgi:DNA (cytosine-5)-methyltransferase 1